MIGKTKLLVNALTATPIAAKPGPLNIAGQLMEDSTRMYPDRVAVACGQAHVSYACLSELVDRVGNILLEAGCKPADRVLLSMPDSPEMIAAILATVKVGAIAAPVPPGQDVDAYAFYLRDTDAAIAVVGQESAENVRSAVNGMGIGVLVIERGCFPGTSRTGQSGNSASRQLAACPTSGEDAAFLLYTSGSTGRQKPALHSHRAVLLATRNVAGEAFGIRAGDRILSTARLFFAFGFGFGMYMPFGVGATTILAPTIDVGELARLIAVLRPTILCGVPSLLDVLLRASASWLDVDLSSLRFIVSAGEPLPPSLFDAYWDRFQLEVLDGIGSTEILTHFITNRPGSARRGSCGKVVPGCDVLLVEDNGVPVSGEGVGRLRIASDTRFLGYWRRPEATACIMNEEWVETGDILYRDAEGFYFYRGRADDMLKISGLWVAPADIESVLREHPAIERCAVTVREDQAGRRRLVAYVVAKNGSAVRPAELYRYTGERLPSHMIPSAFVPMRDLPLTPNGKLKRSALPEPGWMGPGGHTP